MGVCTNQDEIREILDSPLGEILDMMKHAVEKQGINEREWTFNYPDVAFTVKCELKGDSVAK